MFNKLPGLLQYFNMFKDIIVSYGENETDVGLNCFLNLSTGVKNVTTYSPRGIEGHLKRETC